MPPPKRRSRAELARQALIGVPREDSDDEVVLEHPWEWIYADDDGQDDHGTAAQQDRPGPKPSGKLRTRQLARHSGSGTPERRIIGARMGDFQCLLGDTVLLKAADNESWVGLIHDFFEQDAVDADADDDEVAQTDKMARFLWFNSPHEIRNRTKRRTDALTHEIYISTSTDDNSLECISGKATILSEHAFRKRYPNGAIKRNSRDYGKVFICRRGVNTRTATYTDEFSWEDVYGGINDLPALVELVDSQTKATRAPRRQRKERVDHDYALEEDEAGDGEPQTPRKRRKLNDAATPTSGRKQQRTPRKLLVTPTHKRIVVKKPLEFTPLGTRILSPSALSSPFQIARNQLHVSSVPASLPCREEEFSTVYSHLDAAIADGSGSCIYISGTPGTGKTATVREVVAQLNAAVLADELDDFIFVEINGMKVTDPHQSYALLWEALKGDRVSPAHALELLEREFSSPSPRRVPCVVLMDELDQLVTKNQSVMYNFFNWPSLRHSRLIVLAVANTMDLPERTLSNKISSRLGLTRITFPGYTHDQLMQIIQSRLEGVPGNIVHADAVQFAARKVAAVSGDARRALDICRRAVEIAEAAALEQEHALEASSDGDDNDDGGQGAGLGALGTPSRTNRRSQAAAQLQQQHQHKHQRPQRATAGAAGAIITNAGDVAAAAAAATGKKKATVTIATIKQAINEATSSPLQQHLRGLPLASKLFLAALLARIRRTGLSEALLGDVIDEAKRLGLVAQLQPVETFLLLADDAGVDTAGAAARSRDGDYGRGRPPGLDTREAKLLLESHIGRVKGMGAAAQELAEAGIVGLEARRGERGGRVRLGVGDEEVRLALKDDEEVKGLGFQA